MSLSSDVGSESFSRSCYILMPGCDASYRFIPPKSHPDPWPLVTLVGIQIPSLSTTSQVQEKHSRVPTAHFGWNHYLLRGVFAAKGLWECHNLRGAIPRHWFRRPSEVDHDRLLLWSCRCPGWVSATGDLSKRRSWTSCNGREVNSKTLFNLVDLGTIDFHCHVRFSKGSLLGMVNLMDNILHLLGALNTSRHKPSPKPRWVTSDLNSLSP